MNISRSKLCFSIQALNEVETSKTTCDQVGNNVQGLTGKVDKVTKDLLAKQFVIIGRVMYKDLLLLTVNKVEGPIENHSMLCDMDTLSEHCHSNHTADCLFAEKGAEMTNGKHHR